MANFSINKAILVICITVAIYAFFLIWSDAGKVSEEIKKFKFEYVPLIITLVVAGWFCLFARWELLLKHHGIKIPRKKNMQIYFSGFALGVIPGKVGDLIKSQLLKTNFNISRTVSAQIVIIEQIYTIIGLILVSIIGMLYFEIGAYVIGSFIIFLIAIMSVIQSQKLFKKIFNIFKKRKKIGKIIEPLSESHEILRNSTRGKIFFYASGLSTIYWILECSAVFVILLAFGIELEIFVMIPTYTSSIILGVVSFLPLGIGVVEGSLTSFFTLHGIEVSVALTLVIIIRIFTRWISVCFGFIALKLSGGFSIKDN